MRTVVIVALAYGVAARLFEMALSRRNALRVVARGGRRVEHDGFIALAAVHVLWFLGMALEELTLGPTIPTGPVRWIAFALFVAAEAGRYVCIATLGERWNVRVVVLPGSPRIQTGLYKFLDHPNYVTATVGVVALPVALGLSVTAAVMLPLKIAAVLARIRIEERELRDSAPA